MAGLAQKGGAVASHIRFSPNRPEDIHAIRVRAARSGYLVLGGDMVVAGSKKVLAAVKPGTTAMIINLAEMLPRVEPSLCRLGRSPSATIAPAPAVRPWRRLRRLDDPRRGVEVGSRRRRARRLRRRYADDRVGTQAERSEMGDQRDLKGEQQRLRDFRPAIRDSNSSRASSSANPIPRRAQKTAVDVVEGGRGMRRMHKQCAPHGEPRGRSGEHRGA